MNQNRKEELVTRWMDDALGAEELGEMEAILAEHPELREERERYVRLRSDLQAALPAEFEPPYPDFFNSHLERHIESLSRMPGREERVGLRGWLRWWLAPVAAAALVVAFVAGVNSKGSGVPAPLAEGTTAYSPMESVTAEAVQDTALDATVIVLNGLDDIEDENLIGWHGTAVDGAGVYISTSHTY